MLENVSEHGVSGFYTYHFTEGNSFRPCATRIIEKEAIKATKDEFMELMLISSKSFPFVFFGGKSLGNFKLPIHLHPFMWQKRTIQDVNWYNEKNVEYIPFYNYKDGSLKYIPKELSVYYEKAKGIGLSFSPQEGYSYDRDIVLAKVKVVMELIEKDIVTLWWHRETSSRIIVIDDDTDENIKIIRNQLLNQGIDITLLDIENDLGVYVVVCILKQDDFPSITYGSAAHFEIKGAVKHAIFEAISCIVGLRYEFIHLKKIRTSFTYPDFISDNPLTNLSDYKEILNLKTAINKYDIYYSYISADEGYLVKAYCYELQPTLYSATVPLTKRFFRVNKKEVRIKEDFPFI